MRDETAKAMARTSDPGAALARARGVTTRQGVRLLLERRVRVLRRFRAPCRRVWRGGAPPPPLDLGGGGPRPPPPPPHPAGRPRPLPPPRPGGAPPPCPGAPPPH